MDQSLKDAQMLRDDIDFITYEISFMTEEYENILTDEQQDKLDSAMMLLNNVKTGTGNVDVLFF